MRHVLKFSSMASAFFRHLEEIKLRRFTSILHFLFIIKTVQLFRSDVIEVLRKEDNDSEIESEKLLESSTEKDLKEKEVDEKADNVDDSDSTPVVVRRRQKKTSPSTPPLPPGQFF